MSPPLALAAVDLGATSGRVVLGRVEDGELRMDEIHRFRNGPVRLPDGLYWDVLGLYRDVLDGLRAAARDAGRLDGLAVDSWAVDYGLLDPRGALLGNPRHYRDPRTAPVMDRVHQRVAPVELYTRTGMQHLPFTTLYQLAAESDLHGCRALLIPDLIGYWLTDRQLTEETNASTTGLLDARTGDWDRVLVDELGYPAGLLPDVVLAGRVVGLLSAPVRGELGADHEITVTTVARTTPVGADNPVTLADQHVMAGRARHHPHRPEPASMIDRIGLRTRLPDARSRAELAGAPRPLRYGKGRRDPDAPTRGRGTAPHQPPTAADLA